jgi:uncharacterized protein
VLSREELQKLSPDITRVWRIKLLFAGAIATLAAAAYDVLNLFDDGRLLPVGVATVGAIGVFAAAAWILPGLRYRFWRYRVTDQELLLSSGILNRVTTIVPLRRIQHLDVSQDIVEREFGLGKLVVHTAGARSSEVVLPGLAFEEAGRLRDLIKRYITDEPV